MSVAQLEIQSIKDELGKKKGTTKKKDILKQTQRNIKSVLSAAKGQNLTLESKSPQPRNVLAFNPGYNSALSAAANKSQRWTERQDLWYQSEQRLIFAAGCHKDQQEWMKLINGYIKKREKAA